MRQHGSSSRDLAEITVAKLRANLAHSEIVWRDLKSGVGHVNSAWRGASLGSATARSAEERALLAQSDALTSEVERADIMVFAVPIYNFSIPAALKAWVDRYAVTTSTVPPQWAKLVPIGTNMQLLF